MKKRKLITETLGLFTLIALYYIIGAKRIFLYVLSLSLYNILASCFNHITISNSLKRVSTHKTKQKLYQSVLTALIFIFLLFLLISICISDVINILLHIDNIWPIFIMMGLTTMTRPLVKIMAEYTENINSNSRYYALVDIYEILSDILLIVIAILAFRIFKANLVIATSLLYLAKIIPALLVISFMFLINRQSKTREDNQVEKINYWKETKKVLVKDSYRSLVGIVKYSYYYISIIVLYLVLTTRYIYATSLIEKNISFIYFFALGIIDYVIYIIDELNKHLPDNIDANSKIRNNFKFILPLAIIFSILSPLTCKLIFNNPHYAIYSTMVNFMGIFVLLYELTFENIGNKRILQLSLLSGIVTKTVLIIPLINSFYRMGYNLIYGDVTSTILGMLLSVLINSIYLKRLNNSKENNFDKILDILYKNIILTIILTLLQFIIPIDATNYFKSLGIMFIYVVISFGFLKLKRKRRG